MTTTEVDQTALPMNLEDSIKPEVDDHLDQRRAEAAEAMRAARERWPDLSSRLRNLKQLSGQARRRTANLGAIFYVAQVYRLGRAWERRDIVSGRIQQLSQITGVHGLPRECSYEAIFLATSQLGQRQRRKWAEFLREAQKAEVGQGSLIDFLGVRMCEDDTSRRQFG